MSAWIAVERVFDAPRDLVFECLTTPEHLAEFWGPTGTSTPLELITVDLRIGGAFATTMVNDETGEQQATRAVYTAIDPPERLAWRDLDTGMTSTTTLIALDDERTEMHIEHTDAPVEYDTPLARRGFTTSLDRLVAHLRAIR